MNTLSDDLLHVNVNVTDVSSIIVLLIITVVSPSLGMFVDLTSKNSFILLTYLCGAAGSRTLVQTRPNI